MNSIIENLEDCGHISYFINDFETTVFYISEIQDILNLDDETFIYLNNRCEKECAKKGWKKAYLKGFSNIGDENIMNTISLYIFLDISSNLKNYRHFSEISEYFLKDVIHDLLKYYRIF